MPKEINRTSNIGTENHKTIETNTKFALSLETVLIIAFSLSYAVTNDSYFE